MEIRSKSDVRPVPALLRELRDETTLLLRQEMALARAEMSDKTSRLVRHLVGAAIGAILTLAGMLFLLWAVTIGVGLALAALGPPWSGYAPWLAPLLVGTLVFIAGLVVAFSATRAIRRTSVVPEKTVATLKEDKEWLAKKAA